jgi:hypothetical protein
MKFEDARKIVWTLNVRSLAEYILYQQEHNVEGLPSDPRKEFSNQFVSEFDWIGWRGGFWCYQRAKDFVEGLGIVSMAGWWSSRKNGLCPSFIPSNPNTVYLDEWLNWPAFLGYEKISYISYEQAKEVIKDLDLATMSSYKDWWRLNNGQALGLPLTPNSVYKDSGWEGSKSFLGYNKRRSNSREYLNFEDACKYMRAQDLSSHAEWIAWCRGNCRPRNIPSAPDVKYAADWKGFPHFLSYEYEYPIGRLRNSGRVEVMSYEEAVIYIQAKGFTSQSEFAKWSKTVERPVNFPSSPNRKYRNCGWSGYAKFLGYYVEKQEEEEEALNVIGQIGELFGLPIPALSKDMSYANDAEMEAIFLLNAVA